MLKRHKDLLRAIVAGLRLTLAGAPAAAGQRGDLDRELERLGVAPDGALTPLDALPNVAAQERRARAAAEEFLSAAAAKAGARKAGDSAAAEARRLAREELVERAAYSWINRLLALRAMEARGLIDETLRANPAYDGLSEALFVLRQSEPARADGADGGWIAVIEDACTAQAAALPGLFDLADPAVALRPSAPALIRCVQIIGAAPAGFTLAEADAAFADPDAVGWAYQFYQEAAKARVYAKLGAGGKAATRAEIAAATQLFTEPYMVQWLLQNSLGRSYHEAYPDSKLPATWDYYIRNRPEGQTAPEHPRPLEALDLIDPCCGSGHFLREAFDMFAAMYRERVGAGDLPALSAAQIADRVLTRHIHGIDLDPRAAQLAALTLYLRAWEFVRDEERRQRRAPGTPSAFSLQPSALNIATTPSGLSAGALQRHLRRHPEDRVLKPLLEGVFAALEQADILGSLLRPAEHIDAAIKALQQPHTIPMDFEADDADLRRTMTELARRDPAELKRVLLDRVARSFAAEAGAGDVAADLFGREAERGVRLLQLLDRRYAVVVTNPPYMGATNLGGELRSQLDKNFTETKYDLYSAFLARCIELSKHAGISAMLTPHSWMFLESFSEIRKRILSSTSLFLLIHLGNKTFKDISNTNALGFLMFSTKNVPARDSEKILFMRIVHSENKLAELLSATRSYNSNANRSDARIFAVNNHVFNIMPGGVLFYWAPRGIYQAFESSKPLGDVLDARQGLITGDNERFLRFWWEVREARWFPYVKGGSYRRWYGNQELVVDWGCDGLRIKDIKAPSGRIKSRPQNLSYYFREGGTWTAQSSYGFSVRYMPREFIFSDKGPAFFVQNDSDGVDLLALISLANSRLIQFVFSGIQPVIDYGQGYLMKLPFPLEYSRISKMRRQGQFAVKSKESALASSITERFFHSEALFRAISNSLNNFRIFSRVYAVEGSNDQVVFSAYDLREADIRVVLTESGTPVGFHPLVAGYDALPELPADLELPPLPQEVLDYLAGHERIAPSAAELRRIKERLRALYEAGPGAKEDDAGEAEAAGGEDEEGAGAASGAHIPIPTETFLEELSVKMQLHPISVYWLLEELRREGARCRPEERRLLEDRLSVLVLRLLGHRWPKQIEAGEPVPAWADRDGIIALAPGPDGLAERVRARLREEDGDVGANRAEGLLIELTGLSLEEWLRRELFRRHVRQFKYRPIAWHLASDPAAAVVGGKGSGRGRRGGARSAPAFECLLYYHATAGDALARVRTQYVEPLLRVERQSLDAARRARDETTAAQAQARIQELEEFTRRLREVEEQGFACPELDKALAGEPLDRWSGDGLLAPAERDDLLRQERAWRVDLNDGVRVNVAPLQLAGLLVSDVLKAADARKAIADRSRWRSDERRWVREGKLPRCGWMPDAVPESEAWTRLAPQREAERRRLEEKRRAALGEK